MKKKTIFKKSCAVGMAACLTGVCCFGSNLGNLVGDVAYAGENEVATETTLQNEEQDTTKETTPAESIDEQGENVNADADSNSNKPTGETVPKEEKEPVSKEQQRSAFKKDVGVADGTIVATFDSKTGDLIVSGEKDAVLDKDKFHSVVKEAAGLVEGQKKLIIKGDIALPENSRELFFGDEIKSEVFELVIKGNFNTEKVEDMDMIFARCNAKKLDLSSWNMRNLRSLSDSFYKCQAEIIVDNWKLDKLGLDDGIYLTDYILCNTFLNTPNAKLNIDTWSGPHLKNILLYNTFENAGISTLDVTNFTCEKYRYVKPTHRDYDLKGFGWMFAGEDAIISRLPGNQYIYEVDNGNRNLVHAANYEANGQSEFDGITIDLVEGNKDSEGKFIFNPDTKYEVTDRIHEVEIEKTVGEEFTNEDLEKLIGETAKLVKEPANRTLKAASKEAPVVDTSKAGSYEKTVMFSFDGDNPVPIKLNVTVKAPYVPSVKIPKSKGLTVEKGTKITAAMLADTFEDLEEGMKIESFSEIDTEVPGDYVIKAKIAGIYQEVEIPVKVIDRVDAAVEVKKPEAKPEVKAEAVKAVAEKKAVKTGDSSDVAGLGLVLVGAAAGLALAAKKREEN